jgi:CRISPR/Cas system CSM-associated protein Csm4 (group 5 of RAMP superfamily)
MQPNDDELYVNSGEGYDTDTFYAPKPPADQVEQEVSQQAVKAASYPIMGDLEQWFADWIAECNDLDNIQFDVTNIGGVTIDRKVSVEAQILAYRLLKERIQEKHREFEDFKHEK